MKCAAVVFLFFVSICANASQIVFKDGTSAKGALLDTNGCSITILRNENKVEIKKTLISRVIDSVDTFRYDSYVCQEKEKPSQYKVYKYEETPEYRLYGLIAKLPVSKTKLEPNQKILYEKYPLSGSYNESPFNGLSADLATVFSKYGSLQMVSIEKLLACLTTKTDSSCAGRYAMIPYEISSFSVKKQTPLECGSIGFATNAAGHPGPIMPMGSPPKIYKTPETHLRFIAIDLKSQTIVYDESFSESGGGTYFGRPFAESMLETPDGSEKFNKELDANVMDIAEKIQKDLQKQLKGEQ
jgi:hypothetical protein